MLRFAGSLARDDSEGSQACEAIMRGRLAKLDKPQFIPLRKALGQDLGLLKAAPAVDVVGLTVKLDRLAASTHHEGVVADVLKVEPLPMSGY